MAVDTFSCPECQARLRRSATLRPGARVQCPRCQLQFPVPPPEDEEPPLPPRESARATNVDAFSDTPAASQAGFDPLDDLDRDRDYTAVSNRRRDEPPIDRDDRRWRDRRDEDEQADDVRGRSDDLDELARGYRVDIGQWFALGKEHWGLILGPAVGFILIAYLIVTSLSFAVGIGIGVLSATSGAPIEVLLIGSALSTIALEVLVAAPLYSGLTAVSLAQLKGHRWSFADFFAGMRKYPATAGLGLVRALLFLPFQAAQVYLQFGMRGPAFARPGALGGGPGGMPTQETLLVLSGAAFAYLLVYIYLYTRLTLFARALIFDRNFGPVEAIAGSWKLSAGRFWGLLGVVIVTGLVDVGGVMLCGIGLLFTIPLTTLVISAGYLLAAGTETPISAADYDGVPYRRRYDRDEDY